jgi:predicted amidohydrolase YtcJ
MTGQVVPNPIAPQRTAPEPGADLIVRNARVTTLQNERPEAQAFAVRGERIVAEHAEAFECPRHLSVNAVGDDAEIMRLCGDGTRVIDADGRRVIPGLNDSHLHAIRGALLYNLELRWDGVRSLRRGLQMIREQAKRTPKGQWVRVIGGWSPFQFEEKRWPTAGELNDAASDTPVFILFAYSQVMLNKAGAAALKLTPESKPVEGGSYECVDGGGLVVQGTAAVYAAIAELPTLSDAADRFNSTQHFFQELNRVGMTSTVDAGATGIDYPKDYSAVGTMAASPKFPIRISNFLFAQKPGTEMESFKK